jgi:filamentous hemagglutinin family protein
MLISLSQKDFDGKKIVRAKNTGALLLVKAEWCSHCMKLKPILKKVSEKLGSAFPIFTIDADKDSQIVNSLGVDGYPTVFFVNREGVISGKYESDRTESSFLSEICRVSLVCKK